MLGESKKNLKFSKLILGELSKFIICEHFLFIKVDCNVMMKVERSLVSAWIIIIFSTLHYLDVMKHCMHNSYLLL